MDDQTECRAAPWSFNLYRPVYRPDIDLYIHGYINNKYQY